jgi:hypothetical protein
MSQRPTIGDVVRTVCPLTPDGQVEFGGFSFDARSQGGNIDAGRSVRVVGFDPRFLIVREASPGEAAASRASGAESTEGLWFARVAQSVGGVARWVLGALVFAALVLLGALWAIDSGIFGLGYLAAVVGQLWLLVLIIRECRPDAIFLALVVPFFGWYFAYQRWDVAKWAFLLNVGGLLVYPVGYLVCLWVFGAPITPLA